MFLLALFLPGVAVMKKGHAIRGLLLCLLQLTFIGWISASLDALNIIEDKNQVKYKSSGLRHAA